MLAWRARATTRISLVRDTGLRNLKFQAIKPRKRNRSVALLFALSSALNGVGGQRDTSGLFKPRKDPVPTEQEAASASGPVSTGEDNLAPPTGFDPGTVQTVVSRYTDYAARPT